MVAMAKSQSAAVTLQQVLAPPGFRHDGRVLTTFSRYYSLDIHIAYYIFQHHALKVSAGFLSCETRGLCRELLHRADCFLACLIDCENGLCVGRLTYAPPFLEQASLTVPYREKFTLTV